LSVSIQSVEGFLKKDISILKLIAGETEEGPVSKIAEKHG